MLEYCRLRVQDVDVAANPLVARGGKGDKDRITMLPAIAKADLSAHLEEVRVISIPAARPPGRGRRILSVGGRETLITFKVETEQEDDGRWLAEVVELPGVLAYGDTQQAALSKVQALALRVIAERLEHGEASAELLSITFNAA